LGGRRSGRGDRPVLPPAAGLRGRRREAEARGRGRGRARPAHRPPPPAGAEGPGRPLSASASEPDVRLGSMDVVDDDPRLTLLFALADDELILGHRHAEWTGWAPHIEEDLAFSSIAQDEMAHARLLYELAGAATGRDVDGLALGREPH